MRVLIQRVTRAQVRVEQEIIGEIGRGLLVFLGIATGDIEEDISYLANKTANLRIFEDDQGKMNLSLLDVGGKVLVVSQFTLYADCRKGRRPSFQEAARPEESEDLYFKFIEAMKGYGLEVATGSFGADMKVELINDGPVTIMIDSNQRAK